MPDELSGNPLNPVDIGASIRADVGASFRVHKQITRLESDRFEICQNYTITQPPPLVLRLISRPRTRIIHNDGNGNWDIIDPFAPGKGET